MLEIVQFEDGRYGFRNTLTGILLPNKRNTDVQTYRTLWGAKRALRKRIRNFNKTMRKFSSQ